MKTIINFGLHYILKNILFILIILLLLSLIQSKKCDRCQISSENEDKCVLKSEEEEEEDCPCSSARPHYIDRSCYKCTNHEGNYIINNGECLIKEACSDKIIFKANECVGHCPSETCELGDFCYDYNYNENKIKVDDSNKVLKLCKCIDNYKKSKVIIGNSKYIEGKEQYECVAICPSKYYNSDTGECVENCGANKTLEIVEEGVVKEYRCSSKCENDEFEQNNSCLKDCNGYKYKRIDGTTECLVQCSEKDYYYDIGENNNICLNNCPKEKTILYKKDDGGKLIKICISVPSSSENYKHIENGEEEEEYYFEYDGKYFKECEYTKNIFNKATYKISTENKKKCVEDCSLEESTPFLNESQCIDRCTGNYYNKSCLENCESTDHQHDYNMDFSIFDNNIEIVTDTIEDASELDPIIIDERKFPKKEECLEKCPFGTYIDKEEKKCYISSCINSKYINSNLECETCNVLQGYISTENVILKIIKNVEPHSIRRLDDPQTLFYNITRKYCLSSCPKSSPYHNYEKNECFNTSCKERNLYSTLNNPYVCYNSCKLIEGNYNSEKDYICYNTSVTCDNYFYKENNAIKCSSLTECMKKFNYLKGKECTNECGPNNYKIKSILNNNGEVQTIGACIEDVKDCINEGYIFYNNTDRICSKTCDNFYKTSLTNPMKNKENETCFLDCPENYFKDEKKNYVL